MKYLVLHFIALMLTLASLAVAYKERARAFEAALMSDSLRSMLEAYNRTTTGKVNPFYTCKAKRPIPQAIDFINE